MNKDRKITTVTASNYFIKFKKSCNEKLQLFIDEQVKAIMDNADIGELKKGDLKGIRVHKFKYKTQLFLLSYKVSVESLHLYLIGTHENFYKKLKNIVH